MPNNRTENRDYPLPHPANLMIEDAERIATAITDIDGDIHAIQEKLAAADDTLSLPDNSPLAKNTRYFLPAGARATMPDANLADGDWVEFVREGDMVAQPATITFSHPVQSIPPGPHSYNANSNRRFTYKNEGWW